MSTSAEQFEGSGTLRLDAGEPEIPVNFAFHTRWTQLPSRPGFPPRPARAQGTGVVVATDGRVLSEVLTDWLHQMRNRSAFKS